MSLRFGAVAVGIPPVSFVVCEPAPADAEQPRRSAAFEPLRGVSPIIAMAQSRSLRRPGRPRIEMPNRVDIQVGARVRMRRNLLGLSQKQLGEAIGVTFQQVQKYELGENRIGAGRCIS
jgi:ribosome-binding protein aMBF1 (putative translation factor)